MVDAAGLAAQTCDLFAPAAGGIREADCMPAQHIPPALCRIRRAPQSRPDELKFSCNFRIADFGAIRIARAIGGYHMGGTPDSLGTAMSIFGTPGRARASAATRERHATAPSDPEPRRVLPAAADMDDVRRSADGSIDIAFYKQRAQRLRREAALRACRLIRELIRAWFWRKSKSQGPRRSLKIAMTRDCCKEENNDA
jgi:hypothetical protein